MVNSFTFSTIVDLAIPDFDFPSFDANSIFLKFVDLTTPVNDGKSQN